MSTEANSDDDNDDIMDNDNREGEEDDIGEEEEEVASSDDDGDDDDDMAEHNDSDADSDSDGGESHESEEPEEFTRLNDRHPVCFWYSHWYYNPTIHPFDLVALVDLATSSVDRVGIEDQEDGTGRVTAIGVFRGAGLPDEEALVIPESITAMTKLQSLDVKAEGNSIVLPASIAGMSGLSHLTLNYDRHGGDQSNQERPPDLVISSGGSRRNDVEASRENHTHRRLVMFPNIETLHLHYARTDNSVINFTLYQCSNMTRLSIHEEPSNPFILAIIQQIEKHSRRTNGTSKNDIPVPLTPLALSNLQEIEFYGCLETNGLTSLLLHCNNALPSLEIIRLNGSNITTLQPLASQLSSLKSTPICPKVHTIALNSTPVWYYLRPDIFKGFTAQQISELKYSHRFPSPYNKGQAAREVNALVTILKHTSIEALDYEKTPHDFAREVQWTCKLPGLPPCVKFQLQLNTVHREVTKMFEHINPRWTDILGRVSKNYGPEILYRIVRKGPFIVGRTEKRSINFRLSESSFAVDRKRKHRSIKKTEQV